MLLSFRFANHRSFRDEQQLNLLPVYENDAATDAPLEAVPVVGIFGANASGKSNVISAFRYVSTMVGLSDREAEPGIGPNREPFRLDLESVEAPSSYAVDLLIDGVRHTYGFILDDFEITEEWLYSYPLHKRRVIFERTGQEYHWGEESGKSNIKKLTDITAPTTLFLSVSARFQARSAAEERDSTSASLQKTFSWLWQRISSTGPDSYVPTAAYSQLLSTPERREAIVEILRAADLGLHDVVIHTPDADEDPSSFDALDDKTYRRPRRPRSRLKFVHRGSAGDTTLDLREESAGTQRLLGLAYRATSILNRGGVFLVDEIDASLHPLLTATLVKLFQSPTANRNSSQLIFTSHDATLLGNIDGEDVLSRDQVWFTSKGEDGTSELFPLSDFKPRRQGENRQKRYLNGSYGAIPELSMRLFEQAVTSRTDERAQ